MLRRPVLGLIAAAVVLNVVLVTLAITGTLGRDRAAPETVMDFQRAVYGSNFEAMWDLSAEPYRGGRTRPEFLAWARANTPAPVNIFDWTALTDFAGDRARVHTRMQLADEEIVDHRLMLVRRDGRWHVAEYAPYSGPWPPVEPPLQAD